MVKTFTLSTFITVAFTVFLQSFSQGQCTDNNLYYTDVTTSTNGQVATASCIYAGEYATASVCTGVTYTFAMCNSPWDSQITLFDNAGNYLAYDDDGCTNGLGGSNLVWNATFTGVVRIVVDLYNCQTNTTCAVLTNTQTGTCVAACANNNVLYNVNATPTGAGNTVTVTNMYGGEYVNVNVCNGATYTFSSCTAIYDTQLSLYTPAGTLLVADDDGCGTFAGPSTMTWTSNMTGTVRLLLDQYPCVSNTTNTTISITQNTACSAACAFTNVTSSFLGCVGSQANVQFTPTFTGTCTIAGIWINAAGAGWEYLDLSASNFTSGSAIGLYLNLSNTAYQYYFQLSNGALSQTYTYTTGLCEEAACANNNVLYNVNATPTGAGNTVTVTNMYGGEYVNVNVCNGATYTFSSCTAIYDTQLSLYTPAGTLLVADDDGCGTFAGPSTMTWTSNMTGTVRLLLDQYPCVSNTTNTTVTITQNTACVVACAFTNVTSASLGCTGTQESVVFTPTFTGGCTIAGIWMNAGGAGWTYLDLAASNYTSGSAINLLLNFDNTNYQYYFQLSSGVLSLTYNITTGNCDNPTLCFNLLLNYTNTGCQVVGSSSTPSGTLIPQYTGTCNVQSVFSSVNGEAFTSIDVSAYGFISGSAMNFYFNVQNANYEVYYVLSDGSISPSVFFTTDGCGSGETICDCSGTQLPYEATSWLGDGFLDDGTYFWNNNPELPVNFNCATWGFDCGDQLPVEFFSYDPYGVCSGEAPPSNGCVDEFCYSIDLDVATDCHPDEIQVQILNADGNIVFTADSSDFIVLAENLYSFNMCLPAGCYTFIIYDSFGDGMNSTDCLTIGYSGIYDYSSMNYIAFVDGDAYTTVYAEEFCVGQQTECTALELFIQPAPCYPSGVGNEMLPTVGYEFDFGGACTVQSIYYSVNGSAFTMLDVSANGWGSGDQGNLYYLQPNSSYVIYYVTDDGATSFLYNFTTGNCSNEVTICDCSGTQHSIGVTSWLGDGYADNGFYQWAGQNVNFNCATWGYDCGDIAGSPALDPYQVCLGQLPPSNGCTPVAIIGCTDPTALNYNPSATVNDGSCIYNLQVGCTNPAACNYSITAVIDNGSCEFLTCAGCTDPTATNYNPSATIDNGSCIYTAIPGCTNATALNYNSVATVDDGSCIFSCIWPTVTYNAHCVQGDLNNFYITVTVSTLGNGSPYTLTNSYNNQQLTVAATGTFAMGPYPNSTPVTLLVSSNGLNCMTNSQPQSVNCNITGVYGCTDPTALNYNPAATIDDGTCIYTGVAEAEMQHFRLYPNPSREFVILVNNGSTPLVNVRIFDGTGRMIKTEQLIINSGSSHNMQLSDLAQGNYIIEIMSEKNVEHHTLIIQK